MTFITYNVQGDTMKSISCEALHDLCLSGNFINIIDVRDKSDFFEKHIMGSQNIPCNVLLSNPFIYLNYYTNYYIICDYGITSPKVSKILEGKGFNITNVLGGINKWKYELVRKHF